MKKIYRDTILTLSKKINNISQIPIHTSNGSTGLEKIINFLSLLSLLTTSLRNNRSSLMVASSCLCTRFISPSDKVLGGGGAAVGSTSKARLAVE